MHIEPGLLAQPTILAANGAAQPGSPRAQFMYENADEVFEDGIADDLIWEAKREAKKWIADIKKVDITSLEV